MYLICANNHQRIKQVHGWTDHPEADEDLNLNGPAHLNVFGQRVKLALRGLWKDIPNDVFDVGFVHPVSGIHYTGPLPGEYHSKFRFSFAVDLTYRASTQEIDPTSVEFIGGYVVSDDTHVQILASDLRLIDVFDEDTERSIQHLLRIPHQAHTSVQHQWQYLCQYPQ